VSEIAERLRLPLGVKVRAVTARYRARCYPPAQSTLSEDLSRRFRTFVSVQSSGHEYRSRVRRTCTECDVDGDKMSTRRVIIRDHPEALDPSPTGN